MIRVNPHIEARRDRGTIDVHLSEDSPGNFLCALHDKHLNQLRTLMSLMLFVLSQEGSKKTFIDTSLLLQPSATWDVMVEPFAGSAALSMAFGELYPDRNLVIGDTDHTEFNALQQVRDNPGETLDWCWRYARCLEREDGAKWLWTRWTEARDNPEPFSAAQRAALRIHAGPIGSLPALNARGRKTGFSPARAGFRDSCRWVASHADTIGELPRWTAVLQRAEVRLSDYRDTVTTVITGEGKAFCFLDSPYR